jgi:hypothetical protein
MMSTDTNPRTAIYPVNTRRPDGATTPVRSPATVVDRVSLRRGPPAEISNDLI